MTGAKEEKKPQRTGMLLNIKSDVTISCNGTYSSLALTKIKYNVISEDYQKMKMKML
jgi:hypothetical protein